MILLKMFFIQVLCPVLLIAGVQTLTIDSQLGTSIEDCFDRISIGEQLPSTAIYRNVSELTIRECEQICKQDKQCQAYDYGVGAKGNATCNLSTADEKQVKEKSLLSRHPDYDVYVRRFNCEQAPPTPIHALQDEGQNEGEGHTGHRPVFRPVEERPLSDYVVSGDISYRPDDLSNLGPDIGNGPSYGDHRPQDVAFRPPNGPFRPGDYRPGFNDPHRPMGDPFRPLGNDPYRPNDAPNRPNRPRPNDKFRPENPQGPYTPNKPKPDINDELEFQGPPQINNRPDNSPEKPNYHYIVRPNRRPHYDDHQKPTYNDPSLPIGPPNIPYRPNRPHERPPYDYNQQYASNYGQNDVQVQIYDPPRPYVPIKDRPNHPNYGQGFLGYGTYSDQSNSYTGTITEIEKPYGQWPMYADYGPQRPNYRPVANQGTKGSYGSVSQDGYASNNGYGSNSNSYFGSSSGYDSKPSYNSRPGNKPSFVRPSYGFPQSCGNSCLNDGNQNGDNTGYGNGLSYEFNNPGSEPGYDNRPGYATNQSYGTNSHSYGNGNQGYNKPQNNYNIDPPSYNKPDKNPLYNFQSSYGNQKPDNQGYGQQKPSQPNNYYQGDQYYGNGNSQNGYGAQNYGGYGQSYETYGQSYGYDTQSSYGSKGSYGNYDLQGGYNRPSYNDHKKPSYETSYGNQNPSNYPKPNYEEYGFHKPKPTYDNEKPTYGETKPGYGIEKPGYETPSYETPSNGKPSSTYEKPGYNTPSYPKPGYNTEKPSYDTPTYGKPDYSVEKPGNNENSGYGKPDNQSYDPDRPDVKPVYEYEMDKPGDVPSYIARPGGEVVTSRPVVVGDYGERHDYGEQRKSNKACFRRVLAGKRALRSFVRKVINCETLEDCRYECAMEKRFHCESFNYRFDTSFRRKGLCELMTKPIEAFDIHRDFAEDKNSDFYEIDRNSLEPNCPETLGGPGMLHSGFLSSKPSKVGWQDRFWDLSGDRVWDRSGDRGWERGWDRERTWDRIDGMYSNDGGRGGNKRVENFTPYLIGLGRTEKPENWGQYGGNYGGNQEYYKDRNDYHKSYSYWGLTSEKPSYGVKPFTQYDFYKGFNYHTLGKHEFQHPSDFNHPTDKYDQHGKYDQDGGKYDHPIRKYDHAGGKYDHSSSGKFDHRPEYEYGTTATYHPTGKSLIDYHPPGTTSAEYHPPGKSVIYNPPGKTIIDYHPTGKDFDHTSGDFDHHSSLSGDFDRNHHSTLGGDFDRNHHSTLGGDFDHNHHSTLGGDFDHNHHSTLGGDFDHNHHSTLSGDSDHTVSDFDHSKGDYGSWKNRQWNASGGPIEREDKSGLDLLDGNELGVENECISHRNPGMALSSGAIRRSLHAHSVIECETECFTEREFKCVSYSFRYSTSSNTDNCFLSERPYRGVDLSADSGSDVYAMPQDANCVRHMPWVESECFWHVRSGWALGAGGARASLAVRGLGACEAECIRAHGFFCRGFSFRFEPSPKESDFNCILTSSPPTSLSADSLVASAGHELYARGNYGRGCEPHAYEHPREIGECYLQYEKSAMLSAASQRGRARVRDQHACAAACTHAPFLCFSFSYKNASLSTDDNCFLSDIRLFDLKRGVDFVHSDDDLLFSFDVFDSKCLKELSFDKPVSELPRPIQPFPGGSSGPEHPDDHESGKGPFKPGVTISIPSSGPGFEPTFPASGPTGSDFTSGPDYRPSRPSRPERPFTPSKENRPFSTYGPEPEDSNPVDHRPANGDLPYAVPIKPPQRPIYRPNAWSRPKEPTYGSERPNYGPERPTYGPKEPIYGPKEPTYGTERPTYGPEKPTYGPVSPTYGQERPTYGQEKPNHGPERPFKPDFRPKPQIPGYGESPVGSGYLPDQRPQRPQYGADRENNNPMGTWRHYTVSGLPCRGGTVCQRNRVAGHWACEPEGGEVGSWDYCCAPTHRCGYSEGFNKPWCFVGHKEDQWRPCSDKYYPYHQHGRPHPTQGNTVPAAPHARPWRESPAPAPSAPSPPAADRHYWDDLYNNGPSAYYDNNGNPLPGYSRVPDYKEDRRDGPWLAIPQEERPGLGVPRYWPVAYLHKSPPPNMTYFRYNEDKENKTKVTPKDTPESRNIEIGLDTADEVKPNNISYKENRKNTSNIEPYATINKDDNNDRNNTSNIFEIAKKADESKNVQTTTTTTEISLDLTNDTELIDQSEEIKNLDKIEGIDDKLSDFTKSIEVFDLEDANKSEFKTLEAEEKQIEAIGRLVASRRGSKIMLEKRSQKEIEARNIAVDDKTVFNREIAELNRRTGKYNKQADFDNEPTFNSKGANFDSEKPASKSPKPKLDFERPNYSNEKSNSNEKQSFDNDKLNFQTTKVPVEGKTEPEFNFGNKFPTERRGVIKKISKDEIERDRNSDKSLEVSETTFVRPPRVLSTTENIRKALFNGKIFYDATIRDSRDLTNNTRKGKRIDFTPKRLESTTKPINFTNKRFDNVTKKLDFTTKRLPSTTQKIDFTTKRLPSTTQKIDFTTKRLESTTPSVISNSTYYGRKKNIRTRTTDPVRRVKRVYKKRYNPGEVRRRLLDRERKSDNDN